MKINHSYLILFVSVCLGSKLVIPGDCKNSDKLGFVKRPQNPPPPAPSPAPSNRLSNGRSTESISSMTSDLDTSGNNPLPPPRRVGVPSLSVT